MKLVMIIVQDNDALLLLEKLTENDFTATKLASTGGFLKQGNTTIFTGVNDGQVAEVIQIIKDNCSVTKEIVTPVTPMGGHGETFIPQPLEITASGATIFVMDIEQYLKV